MMLPPLTFMIDLIMNLMNKPHHKCEKKKHHSPYSEITSELLEFILGITLAPDLPNPERSQTTRCKVSAEIFYLQ